MSKPRFVILCGDGINCENETALAFESAGANTLKVHINELISNPKLLERFQGMAIPGGFSFGDDLGSGRILSLKIKTFLSDQIQEFIAKKKPIIGICNGFQVLTNLNIFGNNKKLCSLIPNDDGQFIDKWVRLRVINNDCPWTHLIQQDIELPVRHAEGRLIFTDNVDDNDINKRSIFAYEENINGSYKNIAGITDETGLVLGMMPHPEASFLKSTYKKLDNTRGDGKLIFESIVTYLND